MWIWRFGLGLCVLSAVIFARVGLTGVIAAEPSNNPDPSPLATIGKWEIGRLDDMECFVFQSGGEVDLVIHGPTRYRISITGRPFFSANDNVASISYRIDEGDSHSAEIREHRIPGLIDTAMVVQVPGGLDRLATGKELVAEYRVNGERPKSVKFDLRGLKESLAWFERPDCLKTLSPQWDDENIYTILGPWRIIEASYGGCYMEQQIGPNRISFDVPFDKPFPGGDILNLWISHTIYVDFRIDQGPWFRFSADPLHRGRSAMVTGPTLAMLGEAGTLTMHRPADEDGETDFVDIAFSLDRFDAAVATMRQCESQ